MAIGDISEARLNGDRFAESRLGHPPNFGPSLAPTGAPASGDNLLRPDGLGPVTREGHAFESHEQADLAALRTSFASGRKLIAGTALVAALGVGAAAYFLSGPSGERTLATQTAESPPTAVQSAVETSVQAAPTTPQLSAEPSAAAGADVPPSVTVEASPQGGADAAAGDTATRQTVPPWENQIFFLQRPGVNIRSTPSGSGTVLGTALKGTRFTAISREGDWIQVENGRLKGWVNSQFLAANKPDRVVESKPRAQTPL
jgi:Bacterial SH3 domain